MVYLNSAARRAGAPLQTPRQIDDARAAAAQALAERPAPRDRQSASSRRSSRPAEAYGIDPAREGYPDLIALPDEPYWVRTKLAPGHDLGRGRPEPARHPPARGDRRPGGRGHRPRPDTRRPTSATSPRRS